jgi:hypothetical protein
MGFFKPSGILNRRGFFGGAPAFSPKDISGLQLWLDATTGLFDATSGGSAVTTDGSAVARWEDQSGNARNVEQSVVNDRPILKTSIQNSKNVLRFDGTSDYFRLDSAFMFSAGACSVFIVVSLNGSAQAARRLISEGSSISNNPIYAVIQSKSDEGDKLAPFFRNDSGTIILDQTTSYGTAFTSEFKIVGVIDSGSNYKSFINGSTINNNNYTRSGAFTLNRFSIGCLLRGSAGNFFPMNLGEILIYNSELSESNITSIFNYLNPKWAVY